MASEQKRKELPTSDMSFLDHLDALRWTILRSVVGILALAVVAFFFKDIIYDQIILAPKQPEFLTNRLLCAFGNWLGTEALCINTRPFEIINIEMAGQFRNHLFISFMAGVVVATPYILFEIWRFIKPALYDKESKGIRGFVLITSLLFLTGVLFGYYLIVPLAVNFLSTYEISTQVVNQIKLGSYINNVLSISLSTGIIFQLPILIFFFTKIGLVTSSFLKKYRKHSIIVFFLISAIITPPDFFSQILVALPLIGLFEISLWIAKRVEKKRVE